MISPPMLNHVLIKFILRGFPENCLISRVFGQCKKWGGKNGCLLVKRFLPLLQQFLSAGAVILQEIPQWT